MARQPKSNRSSVECLPATVDVHGAYESYARVRKVCFRLSELSKDRFAFRAAPIQNTASERAMISTDFGAQNDLIFPRPTSPHSHTVEEGSTKGGGLTVLLSFRALQGTPLEFRFEPRGEDLLKRFLLSRHKEMNARSMVAF